MKIPRGYDERIEKKRKEMEMRRWRDEEKNVSSEPQRTALEKSDSDRSADRFTSYCPTPRFCGLGLCG